MGKVLLVMMKKRLEGVFGSAFSRNVDFIIQKFALSHSSEHKLLMDTEGPVRLGSVFIGALRLFKKPIERRF